jgi:hypothetical protein
LQGIPIHCDSDCLFSGLLDCCSFSGAYEIYKRRLYNLCAHNLDSITCLQLYLHNSSFDLRHNHQCYRLQRSDTRNHNRNDTYILRHNTFRCRHIHDNFYAAADCSWLYGSVYDHGRNHFFGLERSLIKGSSQYIYSRVTPYPSYNCFGPICQLEHDDSIDR